MSAAPVPEPGEKTDEERLEVSVVELRRLMLRLRRLGVPTADAEVRLTLPDPGLTGHYYVG